MGPTTGFRFRAFVLPCSHVDPRSARSDLRREGEGGGGRRSGHSEIAVAEGGGPAPVDVAVVVVAVHHQRRTHLFEVALALRASRRLAGPGEHGRESGCEDGDDRDHHELLDQGEAPGSVCGRYGRRSEGCRSEGRRSAGQVFGAATFRLSTCDPCGKHVLHRARYNCAGISYTLPDKIARGISGRCEQMAGCGTNCGRCGRGWG